MGKVVESGEKEVEVSRAFAEETFRFSCHPGIPCFTRCCADLYLILTPYDILRLKKRLHLSSGEFSKQYTQPDESTESVFPLVRLKMGPDEGKRCPFVSPQGCTVYEDRPGACRLYPLGRASGRGLAQKRQDEAYFFVRESHCLGFLEEREWTTEEWISDQEVRLYNAMNQPWMDIVTDNNGRLKEIDDQKLGMFSMVSYNLDRFREFVFNTKFLRVFELSSKELEKVASDDADLMKLGMKWLRFALYGDDAFFSRQCLSISRGA